MNDPGTFSQIYIQIIFAVKNRNTLISKIWEEELYKYISGIITNKDQKLIAINGMEDHIHILIGMRASCRLSDLVREIKKSSTNWINERGFAQKSFRWQAGFGAFSYTQSSLPNIISYIENQKKHHQKKSFREEYISFLKHYEIKFKDEYLFEWIE
ncbi:IS200/IS605 family transposase [Algoriphagus machipongonensis]|uniref:Transposase n=1 Tax=Algoriphagus machipongonensis TaxID=388413 RepID=A3HTZ3_9BACT|nr:transposase [Algoriphagus machipongonensis]